AVGPREVPQHPAASTHPRVEHGHPVLAAAAGRAGRSCTACLAAEPEAYPSGHVALGRADAGVYAVYRLRCAGLVRKASMRLRLGNQRTKLGEPPVVQCRFLPAGSSWRMAYVACAHIRIPNAWQLP